MGLCGRSPQQHRWFDRGSAGSIRFFEPTKLNCSFLTLHGCLEEIILVNGDNNYNIPHIGKAALERAGILPDRLLAAGEGAIELASTFLDDLF